MTNRKPRSTFFKDRRLASRNLGIVAITVLIGAIGYALGRAIDNL